MIARDSELHNPESFGIILDVPVQNFEAILLTGGTKLFEFIFPRMLTTK